MNEATRKKGLYLFLVAAIIFGIYSFTQPRKKVASTNTAEPETQTEMAAIGSAPEVPTDINVNDSTAWGEDPFRKDRGQPQPLRHDSRTGEHIAAATPATPHWELSAILFNPTTPMAILNGQMVKIGDMVGLAKVVSIDQKKVVLQYNGSRIEVQVNKG